MNQRRQQSMVNRSATKLNNCEWSLPTIKNLVQHFRGVRSTSPRRGKTSYFLADATQKIVERAKLEQVTTGLYCYSIIWINKYWHNRRAFVWRIQNINTAINSCWLFSKWFWFMDIIHEWLLVVSRLVINKLDFNEHIKYYTYIHISQTSSLKNALQVTKI
jgi:hypothetical protein